MEESRFQFQGFKITRSLIERKDKEISKKISIGFKPKGILKNSKDKFILELGVLINDENKAFNIEIDSFATFHFEKEVEVNKLNNMFYVNAPALLFPYIRAYISTLTNLSGFEPINLPTLNMQKLGNDLKNNTIEEE